MWKRYAGEDGYIHEAEMGAFLDEFWGFNPDEWAVKYWKGVNAYNWTYEGIKPEDFIECWISWDQ